MSDKFKLAVIGSRDYSDRERMYKILDANIDKIEMIVSGGCVGADSVSQEWCKDRGVPILIYYPKWYTREGDYDKGAGFKRNYLIIKCADKVLAFWDNESRGTANSINIAKQLGKPIKIIRFISPPKPPKVKKEKEAVPTIGELA